ncbi:hypothetical protein M4I21_00335 [Cellulophaga sp. 20_2_10]|uniref:hypothetical protein n=1 Tax=Cellulophaga sp. 20_2_10 TaxID=2942476 RepID=UPI00201A7F63|nr:hypothetical protein [Cellulophaga sp. 20_2_10]MCL5244235.1 hypothetical protein [Cellulophaga sp. 20_2_10]
MRNIKQHIVRLIAVSISLLYVLHPLQDQIKDGLHAISHAIETHTTASEHSHSNTSATAHSHSHTVNHEHQVITFINNLFGAPDNDSNDTLVLDIKIDKHIVDTYTYIFKNNTPLHVNHSYTSLDKTTNGYITAVEKPPKSALAYYCLY